MGVREKKEIVAREKLKADRKAGTTTAAIAKKPLAEKSTDAKPSEKKGADAKPISKKAPTKKATDKKTVERGGKSKEKVSKRPIADKSKLQKSRPKPKR